MTAQHTIRVGGVDVAPGEHATIRLDAGSLYTHEPVYMPVHVINGKRPGPILFVSAAIHGDELNGIEIIRRLLRQTALKSLRGTLLAAPIVNVLGVVHQSRYLPDRRDLNRCFPGSPSGSLASRMAHLFMTEVVSRSTHGIDLHTGALHRSNLPQVRAQLDDAETLRLARVFGAPLALDAQIRDGSLRDAATELGIKVLLFEGGEALRFDEASIRVGLRGIINVMRGLGMLRKRSTPKEHDPFVARSSSWVRSPGSGIFRAHARLGSKVERGSTIGVVSDPFGDSEQPLIAPFEGLVIGRTSLPLVHEGEALYHVGRIKRLDEAAAEAERVFEASGRNPAGIVTT